MCIYLSRDLQYATTGCCSFCCRVICDVRLVASRKSHVVVSFDVARPVADRLKLPEKTATKNQKKKIDRATGRISKIVSHATRKQT